MSRKIKKVVANKRFRIASICAAVVMSLGIVGFIVINALGATVPKPYYGTTDAKTKKGEYELEYVLGRKLYG